MAQCITKKNSFIEIDSKKIDPKNYHKIRTDLSQDWSVLLPDTNDVDTNFLLFHNKLLSILDAYTKERCIRVSYKKINKEPWITKGIIASNNKQLRLYKQWLENKDATDYDRYKEYRDELRQIKRKQKINYYTVQCEQFKQNSKKLWSLINCVCSKNNDKMNSLTHISVNGINKYKASEINDKFAEYFLKIGENLANNTPNSVTDISTYLNKIPKNSKSIFLLPCTAFEINKIVSALKPKDSSGYDKITNVLLKDLIEVIVFPLEIIFNQSLKSGIFPEAMKLAEIVPLYKKGSPYLVENYRPISLLITLSKILEKNI